MIIIKPQIHNVLFVGDEGFFASSLPKNLGVSMNYISYDRSTGLSNKKPVDEVVIEALSKNQIDAIIAVPQPNPKEMCQSKWLKLAIEKKLPTALIWYDAIMHSDLVEATSNYSLSIIFDDQKYEGSHQDNIIKTWTPTSCEIRLPQEDRPIDLIFIGNVDCDQRRTALQYLLNRGVEVFMIGNQSWNRVSFDMMFYYLRKSKICLNFSLNRFHNKASLKGRTLEAMLSGAMVLEDENDNSPKYFTPGSDIVSFKDHEDMHDKVKKYLDNDYERIRIASNGQYRCVKDYNTDKWWNLVIPKLLNFKPRAIKM